MYEYKFELIKVIDGDTVDGYIDLGFDVKVKKRIRLLGINAPETRMQSKIKDLRERKRQKSLGLLAKKYLTDYLKDATIIIQTKLDKRGKYGRTLGVIYVKKNETLINVNDLLVSEGLAEEY